MDKNTERLFEINKRKAEIRQALEDEKIKTDDEIAKVETELRDLETEAQSIEKRMKLIDGLKDIEKPNEKGNEKMENRNIGIESKEYRSAYLKNLMGKELTDVEQRALSTASNSAGSTVPTITADKIVTALKVKYPILDAFNFTSIPDNLTIPVHSTDNGAETKAENASLTDSADVFTNISLSGYIVDKYITVSDKLAITSIDSFENYLVNNLINNVGKKIANFIINGTGSNQPTGLAKAGAGSNGAFTAGTDLVSVASATAITKANVVEFLAMVDDATAKVAMSYKSFLTYFYDFMDNAKNNLVKEIAGKYYLIGHEIVFEESVGLGDAYLFAPDFFLGNFQRDIMVEKGRKLAGLQNEYVGHCLFDCKPATGMGKFAKFSKAQA